MSKQSVQWGAVRSEDLAHALGMALATKLKAVNDQAQEIMDELVARGALVEEDGTGCGWRVVVDGVGLLPRKELVFRAKGMAWLCWFGAGRPAQARMIAAADPMVEYAAMEADGPVDVSEISVVRVPPSLSLVKG